MSEADAAYQKGYSRGLQRGKEYAAAELARLREELDSCQRDRNEWMVALQRVKPGMWKDGTFGCTP